MEITFQDGVLLPAPRAAGGAGPGAPGLWHGDRLGLASSPAGRGFGLKFGEFAGTISLHWDSMGDERGTAQPGAFWDLLEVEHEGPPVSLMVGTASRGEGPWTFGRSSLAPCREQPSSKQLLCPRPAQAQPPAD